MSNQGHGHQKLILVSQMDVHGLLLGLGQGEKEGGAGSLIKRHSLSAVFLLLKGEGRSVPDDSLLPVLRPLLKAA